MSRWNSGNWVLGAVIIDSDDNIYPIDKLKSKFGLEMECYYEEKFLFNSQYYKFSELTGEPDSRAEGSFDITAHLKFKDKSNRTREMTADCEGHTDVFDGCFMLLIITPGADLDSIEIDFQSVDEAEFKEAFGAQKYNEWYYKHAGKSALKRLTQPPF